MNYKIMIKCSPNVRISKKYATAIGTRWAKTFLEDGGKPGQCSSAIREMVDGVEIAVFVDCYLNRLMAVHITTPEEAAQIENDIATDPGELQDIAAEAFYKTLPHDGQNRSA